MEGNKFNQLHVHSLLTFPKTNFKSNTIFLYFNFAAWPLIIFAITIKVCNKMLQNTNTVEWYIFVSLLCTLICSPYFTTGLSLDP
jgi:hypothetical protein